jgi:hypothetical protein
MLSDLHFSIKNNILLVVVLLIIPILLGLWLSNIFNPPYNHIKAIPTPSNTEFLNRLNEINSNFIEDKKIHNISSIKSIKRYGSWWYIVNVEIKIDEGLYITKPIIANKFKSGEQINFIINPEKYFTYQNISDGLGIPYELLDDYFNSIQVDDEGV